MASEQPSPTGNAAEASTTTAVGGVTSGQQGATPAHETQAETGGSGGDQLTANQVDAGTAAAGSAAAAPDAAGAGAMRSGAVGAQDTRAQQAGGTGTGLGSPESGANQSAQGLPPRKD